jgi:hypothetical protein
MAEPLASFATLHLIVFPVQSLRADDPLGWSAKVTQPKAYLIAVDMALEAAFRERGLGTAWAFPTDLARTAQRNPTYATAPASIRAGDAARVMERNNASRIPEPVASQIRTLAGFHDARHAMIPVELRFDKEGAGGRAVLHVVILDVRSSSLVWAGDVGGDVVPEFSAAVVTGLAKRFANLVVER